MLQLCGKLPLYSRIFQMVGCKFKEGNKLYVLSKKYFFWTFEAIEMHILPML